MESIEEYVLSVAKVIKRLRNAVRLFNTIKPHTVYQKHRVVRVIAKRTGEYNLQLLIASIPQTRNPEKGEYLALTFYTSRERKVRRSDFAERIEYVMRVLKGFMSRYGGSWHIFIYFIGPAFRVGVYEEAKRLRAKFKDSGLDIRLSLIEVRYGGNLLELALNDLLSYLGSRAYRILVSGSFSRSEGRVYGRLKHLLDYIVAILASIKWGKEGLSRIEGIMDGNEEEVEKYLEILKELGFRGTKGRTEALRPQPAAALPTIRLAKQNLSRDEEEREEEEEYIVEEDRYEVVSEDYERL